MAASLTVDPSLTAESNPTAEPAHSRLAAAKAALSAPIALSTMRFSLSCCCSSGFGTGDLWSRNELRAAQAPP
jgi:hypothetical protein